MTLQEQTTLLKVVEILNSARSIRCVEVVRFSLRESILLIEKLINKNGTD